MAPTTTAERRFFWGGPVPTLIVGFRFLWLGTMPNQSGQGKPFPLVAAVQPLTDTEKVGPFPLDGFFYWFSLPAEISRAADNLTFFLGSLQV